MTGNLENMQGKEAGDDFTAGGPIRNAVKAHSLAAEKDAPGPPERKLTRLKEVRVRVTVQFHLTVPGGSDWYLVSDEGKASRHEGTVANQKVTMTISVKDWAAIQTRELDRIHAWTGGKLKIDGHMGLLMQLEPLIPKFRQPPKLAQFSRFGRVELVAS